MRTTLTDDVIYDKLVASHYGVHDQVAHNGARLQTLLDLYAQIQQGIRGEISAPDWPQKEALFDQAFQGFLGAIHLSPSRKADLMVWGYEAVQKELRRYQLEEGD
jgi:hypothetical protein